MENSKIGEVLSKPNKSETRSKIINVNSYRRYVGL